MFKRTAVAIMMFSLPALAAAQEPAVAWPWMPMQIWAVPTNGQSMPFPTPFWLWVAPAAAQPAVTSPPVIKAETPAPPAASASTVTAPSVAPPPVPEQAAAVEAVAVTPAPAAAPVVAATAVVKEIAKEVVAEPAAAKPAPIRTAPVAKVKLKSIRAAVQKPRKLCFKDGKLDVCQ